MTNCDDPSSFYLAYKILLTAAIFTFTIGIIANLIIFKITFKKTICVVSMFIYIKFITIANIFYMIGIFISEFMSPGLDIVIKSNFKCKVASFLTYTPGHISSWLFLMSAIDRYIFIMMRSYSAKICTSKAAYLVSSIVISVFFIGNSHFLIIPYFDSHDLNSSAPFYNLLNDDNCAVPEFAYFFYNKLFAWIDLIFYAILPFLLAVLTNVLLILRVLQVQNNVKVDLPKIGDSNNLVGKRLLKNKTKMFSLTKTVLFSTLLFGLTSMPSSLFISIYNSVTPSVFKNNCYQVILLSVDYVMLLNHSLIFFVLYKTNTLFRKELNHWYSHTFTCSFFI